MRDEFSKGSIWSWLQHMPFVLIVGSLLYKFFEQSAQFHDEIINVAIAANWDVFAYAIRPTFYGLNAAGVFLFGNNTLTLSFLSYIAFVVLSLVTYQYLRRNQGMLSAVAGVAALAWAGWVFPIGIRGMPHLYPITFMMIAIYCYHRQIDRGDDHGSNWSPQWLVATLLWVALLSHPTAVALLVGFFSMVAMDLVWDEKQRKLVRIARAAVSWLVPLLCFWIITEILFYMFARDNHSYIGYWIDSLAKTSSNDHSKYFQPYGFYFHLVLVKLMPICVLFGACVVISAAAALVTRWRHGRGVSSKSSNGKRAAGLLVAALVSLCVVSLEKWKFDRVLVTFLPLVSLALIYSIFHMVQRAPRFRSALEALAMVVVVVSSFATFTHYARGAASYSAESYPKYSESFDIIRHLPVNNIAYVGEKKNIRRAKYRTDAAGKQLTIEGLSKNDLSDGRSIVLALVAKGYRYVVLDVLGNNQVARRFHQFAHEAGLTRKAIIHSRNSFELWELAPSYLDAKISDRLASLPKGGKIGVLVDRKSELWLLWTLEEGGYRAWFLRKTLSVSTMRKFSVVFVGSRYSRRKSVREVLKAGRFQRVERLSNHMTSGRGIEMWVRQ